MASERLERNLTTQEILLSKSRKPLQSFEKFLDAALPTLSARLWQTCCWADEMSDGWKIGDYNFLILSTSPEPQANLYMQFWSEPLEDVLVEICSGNWNPGALRYLRPPQRGAIEALGYEAGGDAGNYRRETRIASPADAEAVAREALHVFWHIFQYRGHWPLQLDAHQGERATWDAVHESVTPEDTLKLASVAGFRHVVPADAEPGEQLLLVRGRYRTIVRLAGKVKGDNLYAGLLLRTFVTPPRRLTGAEVREVRRELLAADVAQDEDGDLLLGMDLVLDGGVSARWLMTNLELWHTNCRRCARMVAKITAGKTQRARARRTPTRRVH